MTALFEDITDKFDFFDRVAISSFQKAIDKVDAWDDRLIDTFSNSVKSRFDLWLLNHPVFAWLFHHPWVSIITGIVILVLIIRLWVTIYRSIALTIDRMWLAILQSPWRLLRWLFGWQAKPKTNTLNTTITNYEVTNNPEQLQQILTRLDSIQQQQQQIIQDLAELKGRSPHIKAKQVDLTLPDSRLHAGKPFVLKDTASHMTPDS